MIWPAPTEPKVTDVALANPPPVIVMAPPPLTGPVKGLTDATEGQPLAPCSAIARFWSMGVPHPVAASKPASVAYLPELVSVKSLFPPVTAGMSVKFAPLPFAYRFGATIPSEPKQPWFVSAKSPAFVGEATLVPPTPPHGKEPKQLQYTTTLLF